MLGDDSLVVLGVSFWSFQRPLMKLESVLTVNETQIL